MIGVKQGAQFVGVLTPNGVHRALRAALAEMRRTLELDARRLAVRTEASSGRTSRCQDSVTYFVAQPIDV